MSETGSGAQWHQANEARPEPASDAGEDEGIQVVDRALRHWGSCFPSAAAKPFLGAISKVESVRWTETQLSGLDRRMDKVLCVKGEKGTQLLHLEFQKRWEAAIPFRIFEYAALLHLARPLEEEQVALPVRSVVILLSGPKRLQRTHQVYTWGWEAGSNQVVFELEPIYQLTLEDLKKREPPWWAFAPWAKDASVEGIEKLLQTLLASAQTGVEAKPLEARQASEIVAVMAVLAEQTPARLGIEAFILSSMEELLMSSALWERAVEKGRLAGLVEGREEGRVEGRQEGERAALLLLARSLMSESEYDRLCQLESLDAVRKLLQLRINALNAKPSA
ncbi:MAG: hypothetical protein RBU37_03375 [Myxococcota bacterium]|jgi:predicted transposase YdaD|nr:hypothetical protein [Myxococcota bacterium]